MAKCRVSSCGQPSGSRVLCRSCARELQPGELWGLRMAFESPMHRAMAVHKGRWISGSGFGDRTDGTEILTVAFIDYEGEISQARGCFDIADVLSWLEYELAVEATAKAVALRIARRPGEALLAAHRKKTR